MTSASAFLWSVHELTAWKQQRRRPMAQKLFIGGLAFSTSTERLREVFAAAGQVESAAVVTDRDTGRSRGFGFVEMATAEEADQAIAQFNGKDRSEEHTSELQSQSNLVCRLLLEKKKKKNQN